MTAPGPSTDRIAILGERICHDDSFVTYVGAGLFLILIALPLLFKMIPPNPVYGFRLSPRSTTRRYGMQPILTRRSGSW